MRFAIAEIRDAEFVAAIEVGARSEVDCFVVETTSGAVICSANKPVIGPLRCPLKIRPCYVTPYSANEPRWNVFAEGILDYFAEYPPIVEIIVHYDMPAVLGHGRAPSLRHVKDAAVGSTYSTVMAIPNYGRKGGKITFAVTGTSGANWLWNVRGLTYYPETTSNAKNGRDGGPEVRESHSSNGDVHSIDFELNAAAATELTVTGDASRSITWWDEPFDVIVLRTRKETAGTITAEATAIVYGNTG